MKNWAVIILLALVSFGARAQCQDTTNVQPGAFCPPDFNPVCGCNGLTYMNICFAQTQNGILQYTSGVCGGVDFMISPMPVINTLYLKAMTNKDGYLRVMVIDRYGKVFYSNVFQGVLGGFLFETSIDINEVPTEYCFLYVESNEGFKVKPFIKVKGEQ